jgi:hypothetical protein
MVGWSGSRTAIALAVICAACGASGQSRREPDPAPWLSSPTMDGRTRDSLRAFLAYHYSLSFDVVLARPLTAAERDRLARSGVAIAGDGRDVEATAAPLQIRALLDLDPVRRVSCSRKRGTGPIADDWGQRINPEAAFEWQADRCWIHGHAELSGAFGDEQLQRIRELGGQVSGIPPTVSILLPRDALPALVSLPFVTRFFVEPSIVVD